MKTFKINEKEFNISTSWDDLNLGQYIEFASLYKDKSKYPIEEYFMLRVFEVLCQCDSGDLEDMSMEQLSELLTSIQFINVQPKWKSKSTWDIAGVQHSIKTNMDQLTMGEVLSIKSIQAHPDFDEIKSLPLILSILIRPANKVLNQYTKKDEWIQDKFKTEDLESRKDYLMKNCKATDIMGVAGFFLNGNQKLTKITKHSLNPKRKGKV